MKSTLYIALGLIVLFGTSCEMPSFDRYPGERLSEIPKDFQGDWISYELSLGEAGPGKSAKLEYNDTSEYIISKEGWTEVDKEGELLSDSVILSKHKDYYFLSFLEENGYKVMVIQKKGSSFKISPIMVEEDRETDWMPYFASVNKKKDKDGEKYYAIKTDEKEIIAFFKEHMLKQYYMEFKVK